MPTPLPIVLRITSLALGARAWLPAAGSDAAYGLGADAAALAVHDNVYCPRAAFCPFITSPLFTFNATSVVQHSRGPCFLRTSASSAGTGALPVFLARPANGRRRHGEDRSAPCPSTPRVRTSLPTRVTRPRGCLDCVNGMARGPPARRALTPTVCCGACPAQATRRWVAGFVLSTSGPKARKERVPRKQYLPIPRLARSPRQR